jgi:hypothetical protein
MRIIAFTGKKGSGKTAAVEYMKQRYMTLGEPVRIEKINFKDSLIEEMKEVFPGLLEHFSTTYAMTIEQIFIEKPEGMRKLMQDYGLMRRKENPTYWVERWEEKVKQSQANVILTDDVRFQNELDALYNMGASVIQIVRTGLVSHTDTHISETEMESFNVPVSIEAKNLEELHASLDNIIL